jgi:acetylornithine deacetylase/succinyl-diaminopimelate desuccinylase-like protein
MKQLQALDFANNHYESYLTDLSDFLKIDSVSSDPQRYSKVVEAAEWLAQKLSAIGIQDVEIMPTALHPIVYGRYGDDPDKPTVLVYGHYDVQPEDPKDLWHADPFEATIVGNRLYARGATDMKGQVMAGIAAIDAILKTTGSLPANLIFIYEGEEEIGSPSIQPFLEEHKERFLADVVLNLDAGIVNAETPSITTVLRGLAYFELEVTGPAHDLHSGLFGGIVNNPAQALCQLITGMKDENFHITLPDFYDDVMPLSPEDREELAKMPQTAETYLEQTGAPALSGEKGFSSVEQATARPTLDVHGLISGYTGEGAKTVIPSWARAKISMRLVPNQKPEKVDQQLRSYLETNAPESITWKLKTFHGGLPAFCDPDTPATKAFSEAFEQVWGKKPILKREGGSIPIVTEMQKILGIDSVLSGFGLPEDNMHAPNESLNIEVWKKGILTVIHFFFNYKKN